MAPYVSYPLNPGRPFARGVASASPVIANRTVVESSAARAVRTWPIGLASSPWEKRYRYSVPGRRPVTVRCTVRSFAAVARTTKVRARASELSSGTTVRSRSPAVGARVHNRTDVDVISPAATP
jgi:hypothetical protein